MRSISTKKNNFLFVDEPYSPEDSDPDTVDPPVVVPPLAKSNTFLDTSLPTQTFEPFSNKFDRIPGK